MKFKTLLFILLSFSTLAASPPERFIYATGLKNFAGDTSFLFPDSLPASSMVCGFDSSSRISATSTSLSQLELINTLSSNAQDQIDGKQAALGFTPENLANKAQANGYASLDSAGKVPLTQLPASVFIYKGTWNAATNSPSLSNGTGVAGWLYRVTNSGSVNFGAGSISFDVGDYAIYNSANVWEKSDTTDAVASIFGRSGNVVAASGDYTTAQVTESGNLYYTDARARASQSATAPLSYSSSTGVHSFASQNALSVLSAPTGGAGAPTFMALTANHLPNSIPVNKLAALTASTPMKTDASGFASTGAINLASAEVTGTLPASKGGTGLTTPFTGSRLLYTSSTGAISEYTSFTPSQILTATAGGLPTSSTVTTTQLTAYQNALSFAPALSVVARDVNSTGAVTNVTAGSDGYALVRSGSSLIFGQVGALGLSPNIPLSKLFPQTANRLAVTDASGFFTAGSIPSSYFDGLASNIQDQINAMAGAGPYFSHPTGGSTFESSTASGGMSGENNSGYGVGAITNVTTGYDLTSVGRDALNSAEDLFESTGVGSHVFSRVTTGNGIVGLGANIAPEFTTGANSSIAIGTNLLSSGNSEFTDSTLIGNNSFLKPDVAKSTLITHSTKPDGGFTSDESILIGYHLLGSVSASNLSSTIVLGNEAIPKLETSTNTLYIGEGVEGTAATTSNEAVIASSTGYHDIYIGKNPRINGEFHEVAIHPASGLGDNVDARESVISINGAQGTGTGRGGHIVLRTAPSGTAGSSLNALQDGFILRTTGVISAPRIHNNSGTQGNAADPQIRSGTYTPTLTLVGNLDSATAGKAMWSRVGNVVTVSGRLTIDPTTAAASAKLGISLPLPSNLATTDDLAGSASGGTVASPSGQIMGDAANDRAELDWIAVGTASGTWGYTFSYEVL